MCSPTVRHKAPCHRPHLVRIPHHQTIPRRAVGDHAFCHVLESNQSIRPALERADHWFLASGRVHPTTCPVDRGLSSSSVPAYIYDRQRVGRSHPAHLVRPVPGAIRLPQRPRGHLDSAVIGQHAGTGLQPPGEVIPIALRSTRPTAAQCSHRLECHPSSIGEPEPECEPLCGYHTQHCL